jgi:hypothetical protein
MATSFVRQSMAHGTSTSSQQMIMTTQAQANPASTIGFNYIKTHQPVNSQATNQGT